MLPVTRCGNWTAKEAAMAPPYGHAERGIQNFGDLELGTMHAPWTLQRYSLSPIPHTAAKGRAASCRARRRTLFEVHRSSLCHTDLHIAPGRRE